jgi:uncharacterized repeat protein (TIGR02543 family)
MKNVFALIVVAFLTVTSVVSGSLVDQYFPMHNGDWRSYQDYYSPDDTTFEQVNAAYYNGNLVFPINFHDEWNTTSLSDGTWYLASSSKGLMIYGIHTAWGSLSLSSPGVILTDALLTKDGTSSSTTKGSLFGQSVTVTFTSKVTSIKGPVTVPAGTFQNCKALLVSENVTINGIHFSAYDSAAWLLAPGVGIIADGFATWDPDTGQFTFDDLFGNQEDYFELADYSVSALPTVTVTITPSAGGSVTPNYNGQALAVGTTYSMTAKANKGFKFVGWTGNANTSSPKMTFTMLPHLAFVANFSDSTRPVNAITYPVKNKTIANTSITVTGKASDNLGVASVWYQLNGGGWKLATTANAFANWTAANLPLNSGANLIEAFAKDAAGNASLTNSIKFVH